MVPTLAGERLNLRAWRRMAAFVGHWSLRGYAFFGRLKKGLRANLSDMSDCGFQKAGSRLRPGGRRAGLERQLAGFIDRISPSLLACAGFCRHEVSRPDWPASVRNRRFRSNWRLVASLGDGRH